MTQPFHCSLITKDVLQLTNRIQHSFPGLYAHLDETPFIYRVA